MTLMDTVILPSSLEDNSFWFDRSQIQSGQEVLKDKSCPDSQLCLQESSWTFLPLIFAKFSALPNISDPLSSDLGI